jgi:hypothetical protein
MSPNTGRYQSQLLNLLNRQGQRFKDQTGLLWRNLKLATVWGGQLALYPIYALFQASRMATRQLSATAQETWLLLNPAQDIPADLAIQRVLDDLNQTTIARFGYRARAPKLSAVEPSIAAIATSIDGHLQLITTNGEILTATEQTQLQSRLTWEMASYWKAWRKNQRSLYLVSQSSPSAIAPPSAIVRLTDRPNLSTPARLFYQLMAWVQQGPLAHRTNWFAETAIVAAPSNELFQPQLGSLPGDAWVTARQGGMAIYHASETTVDRVKQLIEAAIEHFFGISVRPLKSANLSQTMTIAEPEATLTEESIVGEFVTEADSTTPEIATAAVVAVLPNQTWREKAGEIVKTATAQVQQVAQPKVPEVAMPSVAAIAAEGMATDSGLTWHNVFSSDPTTTWLEVEAQPTGYVKHPLELVLGWFDRGIAWLEQCFMIIWTWLKGFFA